jgi:hypothetical protein
MAQFVNEYQKNEHDLNELFESLTNWDKGRFIEKNLRWLEYSGKGNHYRYNDITENDVLKYIDENPNIIETIMEHVAVPEK